MIQNMKIFIKIKIRGKFNVDRPESFLTKEDKQMTSDEHMIRYSILLIIRGCTLKSSEMTQQ